VLSRTEATRYVTPLREGGSLPGIVEAADLGTYVVKFTGAGQGVRVLVAEVLVARIARALGLRVPELVLVSLDHEIARYEADQEVQELLTASVGLNLGVDFLPGSFGFDPHLDLDDEEAGTVLWLDAFVANVDRSWRNPNLLLWHDRLWCIDHGAALYFHHGWATAPGNAERFARQAYDASQHALGRYAGVAAKLDDRLAGAVTRDVLETAASDVPDEWLPPVPDAETPHEQRRRYVDHLTARLADRSAWLPKDAGR
jgi:hypothetical protein